VVTSADRIISQKRRLLKNGFWIVANPLTARAGFCRCLLGLANSLTLGGFTSREVSWGNLKRACNIAFISIPLSVKALPA
jgi:hypothetical protein